MVNELEEMEENSYSDWKSDNISGLKDVYVEEHEDEFEEFCKETFKMQQGE